MQMSGWIDLHEEIVEEFERLSSLGDCWGQDLSVDSAIAIQLAERASRSERPQFTAEERAERRRQTWARWYAAHVEEQRAKTRERTRRWHERHQEEINQRARQRYFEARHAGQTSFAFASADDTRSTAA